MGIEVATAKHETTTMDVHYDIQFLAWIWMVSWDIDINIETVFISEYFRIVWRDNYLRAFVKRCCVPGSGPRVDWFRFLKSTNLEDYYSF
jgi:hypothetical protein